MLVLNTNQGNGGFAISNNGSYPDFNQILLIPTGLFDFQQGSTPATNTAIYSINGTPVNREGGEIIAPVCFGSNVLVGGCYFIMRGIDATARSGSFRLGLNKQLKGGEIVGKTMQLGIPGFHVGGPSNATSQYTGSLDIDVKLLHSDGTLTSIGSLNMPSTTWSLYGNGFVEKRVQLMTNTNGVIAQQGDIVVADFTFTGKRDAGSSSSTNCGVYFGYTLGDGTNTVKGVQVSID